MRRSSSARWTSATSASASSRSASSNRPRVWPATEGTVPRSCTGSGSDGLVNAFSTAITRMQALNPPSDARDAHNKFLQDVENAKTKSSDLKNQLANASTTADVNTVVDTFNTAVDALVSDANVACVALQ